jgi:molybdenum cofactor synthesis domain-containing protein
MATSSSKRAKKGLRREKVSRSILLRKRYLNTVGKQEALRLVREAVGPLERTEEVLVPACKGRITAGPIRALVSNPPYTCAAMDGYAVSFEKTVEADLGNPVALLRGSDAIPVNTGDPLPQPMNAVIMVEDAEEKEGEIIIRKPAYLWQHVRLTGEDIIEGDILFPANYTLGILDLGLLLGAGIRKVTVRQKPRLLITPTGHELIDIYERPIEELKQHRLIDFNSYLLMALGEEMGFEVTKSEIARNKDELRAIMAKHIPTHDVLAINAGSSAGTEDITEDIIQEFGELVFHGVSMMPGKPTMFGLIEGKPVFGIPGYPVSAVISFKTFLQAVYDRLCSTHRSEPTVPCITPYKIPSSIGVEEVLRVRLVAKGGKYYAYPLARGAGVYSSLSQADGLVRIPENTEGYLEGEELTASLLRAEDDLQNRINIIGSHDLSLDVLRDMIKMRRPSMDLVSAHVGSLSGIMAMQKGIIDVATTHILDEEEKVYNIPAARRYLPDRQFLLIHIARRIQGLLTAKGNPKGIKGVNDLPRKDIRFVNRQFGSGTRILLDMMLKEHGVDRTAIQGYDREESTHAATAILVKEGIADVGLAIYPVSRIFGLDFIPLMEEEYDLLVTKGFSKDPRFELLMELLTSPQFASRLDELGGYNTKDSGKIKYVSG